ncbi:MAG TPA: hypothetical protein VKE42_01735 [Candidatus Cybelea sp.]|nr:hypothetical protein [Candidatus Cybelea sp.]
MPIVNPDYAISAVADVDAVPEILAFYEKHRTKGVRKVNYDEVKKLVEDGLFYVARSTEDDSIVATVYVSEQKNATGTLEYEIGGGLVGEEHRSAGLSKCLGVCAIAAQRLATPRDKDSNDAMPTLIARVECSNKAPIRQALRALGFKRKRVRKIKDKPGLDDMQKDADGNVCVEEFEFDDAKLEQRLADALSYRDDGVLTTHPVRKTVRIDVHALNPNAFGDPLRDS